MSHELASDGMPQASNTPTPETQQAMDFLKVIIQPGQVFEVRGLEVQLKGNRTDSGYFDDVNDGAALGVILDDIRKPRGVYVTLNPVTRALMARSANKIKDWAKETTSDEDITKRLWLFVDLDPKRPSGISATDDEKDAVIKVAADVRTWLMTEFQFCEPVEVDSGNGRYLLWPIDLPNDESARVLVSHVLKAVHSQCGTEAVTIDTTVSNAARIIRMPGTLNRKGDNIPERPHRRAALVSVPDALCAGWSNPVSREQLEAVAKRFLERQLPARSTSATRGTRNEADIVERARRYLSRIEPAVSGEGGHSKTLLAAEHLVRGFELSDDEALPLLLVWNQTCQPPWDESELRHKLSEARDKGTAVEWGQHLRPNRVQSLHSDSTQQRRSERQRLSPGIGAGDWVIAKDRGNFGQVLEDYGQECLVRFESPDGNVAEKQLSKCDLESAENRESSVAELKLRPMSLARFMQTSFPQNYLVRDVLIAGQVAVIGAPKKTLKTSICCDLALSLATATPFLGKFEVPNPCRVLMLSGESGPAKLQTTFQLIARARDLSLTTDMIHIEHEVIPQLACSEHLRVLAEKIIELQADVVILDPLYLMLLGGSERPINPADMFQMGKLLRGVDETIRTTNATLILVHHATKAAGRKAEPLDLDDLSQAGIGAFTRQWLLLSPKAKFDSETGTHELFLEIGGSAGHFGSYVMTVVEGRGANGIHGKRWHVLIKPASDAREHDQRDKEHRREVESHNAVMADVNRLVEELGKLPSGEGLTQTKAANRLDWNNRRTRSAIAKGYEKGFLAECRVRAGNGREYEGFRLTAPQPTEASKDAFQQLALALHQSDTPTHSDKQSDCRTSTHTLRHPPL